MDIQFLKYLEENIKDLKKSLKKQDVQALYVFLEEFYSQMDEDQKTLFAKLMEQLDEDFYKDENE